MVVLGAEKVGNQELRLNFMDVLNKEGKGRRVCSEGSRDFLRESLRMPYNPLEQELWEAGK